MPSPSDRSVRIILVALILLHVAILLTPSPLMTSTFLNLGLSTTCLSYWTYRALKFKRYTTETREKIVIAFEVLVAGSALYLLCFEPFHNGIMIIQYIIAGIHSTILIAFFIFMFAFKIKRLF
jgi:hypothetical protein